MPFYDYKCLVCNKIFEIQKGMNEILLPKCPDCGGLTQRVFYAPRTLIEAGSSEQSSSCSTCSSGVCSSCNVR